MKKRIMITIFIIILFIAPMLMTSFPPATDLPQHLSQIHLLKDTLKSADGLYRIQWTAPNTLVYVFIYLFWQILPPELVGKAILILMILSWIFAIHILAEKRGIPFESTILASLFVFNLSFYWGFLNFLIGFPVFVIWFALTSKNEHEASLKEMALIMTLSFLLYLSHALWFAVGAAWLLLINVVKKTPWKPFFMRFTALLPSIILSLIWFLSFAPSRAEAGFKTAPHWPSLPYRLSFTRFLDSAFGGIKGPTEFLVFCFICLWATLLIWKNRKRLNALFDKELLTAGFFFLIIFFIAPSSFMNTIFFSSRWSAIAVVFFIMSLRLPLKDNPLIKAIPFFIAFGFILITSLAWHNYSSKDLSGFKESLASIPPGSKVLGLDTIRDSDFLKGEPFFQMFSYAQAFKECELSFSFAEHGTGIVVFREINEMGWTKRLEWYPERTKKSDLRFFDFVLVNTDEETERIFLERKELIQLTASGSWQLYKVQTEKVDSETDLFQDEYLFFSSSTNEINK